MKLSFRHAMIAATVFALGGLAATSASADPSTPPTQVDATSANGHDKAATVEQRIKDMHSRLLISPAQQPQWDAFADVMRSNSRNMEQTFQRRVNTLAKMTAPENMQSYAQVAENHAQNMQRLVPAFKTLYDTMSDSQRKTADQMFRDDAHRGSHARHG